MKHEPDGRGFWVAYTPSDADSRADESWGRDWEQPARRPGPLNRFSVQRYHVQGDDEAFLRTSPDVVVPVVDGIALFEMVGDYFPGVPLEWMQPAAEQWLGSPKEVGYGRAVVLDGWCGGAECCGLMARISVLADTVVWDHFFPLPFDGLRFEFARDEYERQVRRLDEIQPTEWVPGHDET